MSVRPRAWLAAAALAVGLWAASHAGTALVIEAPVDAPDAIVSLASHEWERLPATAALATRYPSAVVVLTQPQQVSVHNCHRCAERVEDLGALGVDRARVRVVPLTLGGTRGEAAAVRGLATRLKLRRVLVVTSPYHTRRTLAVFRRTFEDSDVAIGVTPATATSAARPTRWWTAAYDRWYVTYEWAATVYYALRYGMS